MVGLKNRPRPGRPLRLKAKQRREALRQLKRVAQAFGYETERWSLDRVQQLIKQEYGAIYNANYLSDKLRRLGWSQQQTALYAKERDEELIPAWLQQDWPRIKNARRLRATIILADETGWLFSAPDGTT